MSFLESDASKNHPSLIFNANYSPLRGNQLASFSFQPFSIEIKENLELIGNHLISTHTNFEEGKKKKQIPPHFEWITDKRQKWKPVKSSNNQHTTADEQMNHEKLQSAFINKIYIYILFSKYKAWHKCRKIACHGFWLGFFFLANCDFCLCVQQLSQKSLKNHVRKVICWISGRRKI